MKILLDTHVCIWLALDRRRIPEIVADKLAEAEDVYISFAAAWEYGIKRSRRPRELELSFDDLIDGIPAQTLGLDYALHRYAESLPPIHHDPFDRMMIAQAIALDLHFVTKDEAIKRYPVRTLW